MTMTTLKKILRWLGAALVGIPLAVYIVFFAANWRDQPVSPAALRLDALAHATEAVDDKDNGYVYMMGFSVGPSEDPRAWGAKRIAWAQEESKQSRSSFDGKFPGENYDFVAARSAPLKALTDACKTVNQACLKALDGADKTLTNWVETEAWVLARYQTLLTHPKWQETLPFDMFLPARPVKEVQEGQKLQLAQAWGLAGRKDSAGVKTLLENDLRFWRGSLAASSTLLSKMIAARAIQRHFDWGNIVLRRLPPAQVMAAVPALWSEPVSDAERAMLRSMAGDWAFFDTAMRRVKTTDLNPATMSEHEPTLQRWTSHALKPMLQPQDNSNRYAALIIQITDTLNVPYAQHPQAIDRARAALTQATQDSAISLYNPLGINLFSMFATDIAAYADRVADLEGQRRAALLASQLRSRAVAPALVEESLTDTALRNPYSDLPFAWDEHTQAIVFQGREPGERGRHAFFY
jgi:hypothetical protein